LNELDNEMSMPSGEPESPSSMDDSKSDKKLAKRVLPPPERMVTRGVSGAIRHRSVDEILSAAEVINISPFLLPVEMLLLLTH
jgi:hypothetical protein